MQEPGPFDRRLRRLRRDRAAARGNGGDFLDALLAAELMDRLELVTRKFENALVIGCAGDLSSRLSARGLHVVSVDPGAALARRESGIQADEDRLPIADGTFDLALACGTLDSVNDLPGALTLIRRSLRPDGLFLAAFTGAGSLPKLKQALLQADLHRTGGAAPRIHPQIDVRAAGDLLMRAGFQLPVVDLQQITLRYAGLPQLVDDLRSAGATNILAGAHPPLDRAGYAFAQAAFAAQADADGKISETLAIIHLSAWSPSPDQPRPARRGSGTQSLAEVLRPKV